MDPPEPSLQVAKLPTRRDTTQPLKKAGERKPGSFAHLPVQQEQQVELAVPQQRVKSIAQRSKRVSLRQPPVSRRKTPVMPLNERPSNDGGKRALSRVQAMAPGYPGRVSTYGKSARPPSGKPTRETKNLQFQTKADAREAFVNRKGQEGMVHHPVIPDGPNRRSSKYPGRNERAATGAGIKSTPKEIPPDHYRHESQAVARVLDLPPSSAPRRTTSAFLLPPAAYPARLSNVKKEMPTWLKPGPRIRKADFSMPVDEAGEAASAPGGKINPKLPEEVRGSTAKPPLLLSPAKSSRASRSRGVPFPARPLDVNGARSRPVYVFHDLEGRAKVPDGLRRQEQRKTADVLADMRGLTKVPVASKFDPFPQPSNLASGVGASGLGFETTPVPDRKWKKQQEARSSFPALEHLSQLYDENEPKKDLYFPEPEQILAMQRVAAMCVFVVSVVMLLFTGYYILWLRDAASLSSHAPFPPGQTDSDDSFPVLPFMFSTEKLATTDSAE